MNAKRAKALRRIAQRSTVGAPAIQYERSVVSNQRRVDPRTTRGVYRDLKRTLESL